MATRWRKSLSTAGSRRRLEASRRAQMSAKNSPSLARQAAAENGKAEPSTVIDRSSLAVRCRAAGDNGFYSASSNAVGELEQQMVSSRLLMLLLLLLLLLLLMMMMTSWLLMPKKTTLRHPPHNCSLNRSNRSTSVSRSMLGQAPRACRPGAAESAPDPRWWSATTCRDEAGVDLGNRIVERSQLASSRQVHQAHSLTNTKHFDAPGQIGQTTVRRRPEC